MPTRLMTEFISLLHSPVASDASSQYDAEKKRSSEIDALIGISYDQELGAKTAEHETWSHLSPQIFQTPYAELVRMIEDADPTPSGKAWVDLGAAYGRMGIVLTAIRPVAHFIGIELVESRVTVAKKVYSMLGLNPEDIRVGNCEAEPLPSGDIYFIYDFGTREAVTSALQKIQEEAKTRPIFVIGRGRRVRDLIEQEHPWLGYVVAPLHREHYSVYRTHTENSA